MRPPSPPINDQREDETWDSAKINDQWNPPPRMKSSMGKEKNSTCAEEPTDYGDEGALLLLKHGSSN
jgi:hypothetical protein